MNNEKENTTMSPSEIVPLSALISDLSNTRKHSKKNLEAIKGSLARFGQQKPIVISKDNIVIAGNGTLEAAKALGWTEIEVKRSELSGSDITAYAIADNRTGELAEWDLDVLPGTLEALGKEFDLGEIGFDSDDLAKLIGKDDEGGSAQNSHAGKLVEKFIVPPFTVLDARQGYWQERKKAWLAIGIQSELGRGG